MSTEKERVIARHGPYYLAWVKAQGGGYKKNIYFFYPASTVGPRGKRSTDTADETRALEKFAEFIAERKEPTRQSVKESNVGELIQWYLTTHALAKPSGPQAATICAHLTAFFGEKKVGDLRSRKLVGDYIELKRAAGLVDNTINGHLGKLAAVVNRAYDWELLVERPPRIRLIGKKERRQATKKKPLLNVVQIRSMLRATKHTDALNRLIIIMIATACRPGAGLQLTVGQLDFDHDLIYLASDDWVENGKLRPPVKMVASIKPLLREWIAGRENDPTARVIISNSRNFRNKPVRTINSTWERLRGNADLDDRYVPYCIRKTLATELNRAGVEEKQIGIQLGHRGEIAYRTTAFYVEEEVRPGYQAHATQVIDNFLAECLKPEDANVMQFRSAS